MNDELEIICPKCHESNFADRTDLEDFTEEDVLECSDCGAFIGIVSLEPLEVTLVDDEGDGLFVECPECGLVFELDGKPDEVRCQECNHAFTPDFDDLDEDDDD